VKPVFEMARRFQRSRLQRLGLKIATNLAWPSFRNVALDVQKAIGPYCNSTVVDLNEIGAGGNILVVETVRKDTLKLLRKLLPGSRIVFYGTTEGHSFLDEESVDIAKEITIVAVSNFVKQMLEEVDLPVAGIVHHGIDMDAKEVDARFLGSAKKRTQGKLTFLTIASNDPRKGLEKLLEAYRLVERRVPDSFLVLHSQPKRYFNYEKRMFRERHLDLPELASRLGIERTWLTNRYGLMTSEEVNAFYRLCHVYVLPSFAEGFGLSMLEAYRFDKPVIAVDAPPFNEIIEDERSGKLIPYREIRWFNYKNKVLFKMHVYESSSLAEAMSELLTDIDLRERMSAYIKEKKYNWDIHELYPKLLEYF